MQAEIDAVEQALAAPEKAKPPLAGMSFGALGKRREDLLAKLETVEAQWMAASEKITI